jgi:choline/glycine/proline betaine transport protein
MDEQAGTEQDRLNPIVFYGSVGGIVLLALWTILFTESATGVINSVLGFISTRFGWFYFLAILVYLVFVIVIAASRFGDVRLGPAHSKPEFNVVTWAAMLFAAGIGIDLLFYVVVEPVSQFLNPPVGDGGTQAAARHALELTYLHWGLSGWGVYSLVGMSLAFFSYRYGLPLAVRSALFPLLGNRIYGWIGNVVDGAAILGTIFGIATSLGIGIIQLSFGLNYMFGIPETVWLQAALAAIIVVFSALSAVSGVERGIRRLSEINMLLATLLLLFVLFAGETIFLLNALVMNVGDYFAGFINLSTNTYPYDPPIDWLNAWTVFFWAWWIAWGPFVGMFLARISRGRTIRQFVFGSLLIPLAFMMAWMSIIGNSAIDMVMAGTAEFGQQVVNEPGSAIYRFLQEMPLAAMTTLVTTILAIIFFVTSGDSGSLVLSNLSSILRDPNADAPTWMRILWAAVIGLLTVALLLADGLTALQSATVIMGLPFAIVLFVMMIGLLKALRLETIKRDSSQTSLAGYFASRTGGPRQPEHWRQRLARLIDFPSSAEAQRFMETVGKPALTEVRDMLREQGYAANLSEGESGDEHLALRVDLADAQDFGYEIRPSRHTTPTFAMRAHQAQASYYRLEAHLIEGGQGYDVMGYSKEQLVDDVLDQLERHMNFVHAQQQSEGSGFIPE